MLRIDDVGDGWRTLVGVAVGVVFGATVGVAAVGFVVAVGVAAAVAFGDCPPLPRTMAELLLPSGTGCSPSSASDAEEARAAAVEGVRGVAVFCDVGGGIAVDEGGRFCGDTVAGVVDRAGDFRGGGVSGGGGIAVDEGGCFCGDSVAAVMGCAGDVSRGCVRGGGVLTLPAGEDGMTAGDVREDALDGDSDV